VDAESTHRFQQVDSADEIILNVGLDIEVSCSWKSGTDEMVDSFNTCQSLHKRHPVSEAAKTIVYIAQWPTKLLRPPIKDPNRVSMRQQFIDYM
jgi:hypothetical protein